MTKTFKAGQKAMGKIIAASYQFESESSPGTFHEALLYVDYSTSCNCRGWIFNHKCWHVDEVKQLQNASSVHVMMKKDAFQSMPKAALKADKTQRTQSEKIQSFVVMKSKRVFRFED
jgi:hypothetical protein